MKIAMTVPELRRRCIDGYRLKALQRTPYRLDVAFSHSRRGPPAYFDLDDPAQIIDVLC
jgi:hypothetical protein